MAAYWLLAAGISVSVPVAAAWPGVWQAGAEDAVVGRDQVYIARHEDTLLDIARRFGMGLAELRLANPGVDIWLPGEGSAIRLPSRFILPEAPRSGLVVNVAEMRVYYFPKGESNRAYMAHQYRKGRLGDAARGDEHRQEEGSPHVVSARFDP